MKVLMVLIVAICLIGFNVASPVARPQFGGFGGFGGGYSGSDGKTMINRKLQVIYLNFFLYSLISYSLRWII